MPDPTPHDGFTFYADEAEKAVKQSLPAVAEMFEATASPLVTHDWMGGVGRVDAAGRAQDTFYEFLALLGRRQFTVGSIAYDTAAALQDVVTLYRCADGQV